MIFCDLLKSVSTTWPMLLKVLRAAGYISSAGGSSKTSRQPAPWSSVPANFLSKIICSHKHCVCDKQCRHVKRDKTGMSRADPMIRRHTTCAHTGSLGLWDQGFAGIPGRMWGPGGSKQSMATNKARRYCQSLIAHTLQGRAGRHHLKSMLDCA